MPASPSSLRYDVTAFAFERAACQVEARRAKTGGGERDRTDDLLLAKQALSQLSYTPDKNWWVWVGSNHRPPPYQDGALTS